MREEVNMVREFHKVGAHPAPKLLTSLDTIRIRTRAKWMEEEVHEFIEGNSIVEQTDALIDLIYFALGTLVEMGVHPGVVPELFSIVHDANMKKYEQGVYKHDDTKVRKGKGWIHPTRELLHTLTEGEQLWEEHS